MTDTFTDTILNMDDTAATPEDYTGEDGLLYCGKCRQPKEAFNIIYTQIGLEFFLYTHMGCFVYLLT